MTDAVGVITGGLTIATSPRPNGRARIVIQYTGAEEWYTLTGSPASGLAALHTDVVQRVRHGGATHRPRISRTGGSRTTRLGYDVPRPPRAHAHGADRP
ncbi:hypothetical protein, partial [Streptomyces broussonetiae]|uniref:hypothetical protein n=1 Tax=Streptomyces broussonetiae TaxID=2686304 RepID=UPI0035DF95C7